jgi:hypothetical protein
VLARLNDSDLVAASFLSWDGTRLLIEGRHGATADNLVAAGQEAVAERNLKPNRVSQDQALREWAQREDTTAWVSSADLWRLSWREAETFADRLTTALVERFGTEARGLKSLLTESFFEGVRPPDGSGPISAHWPKGASTETRREVLLRRAADLLNESEIEGLRELLSTPGEVRRLISCAHGVPKLG